MHIQDKVPWCLLFTNDIVSSNETKVRTNYKLQKEAVEPKSLKLSKSKSKTKHMECKYIPRR